jgi:hypothetical protein
LTFFSRSSLFLLGTLIKDQPLYRPFFFWFALVPQDDCSFLQPNQPRPQCIHILRCSVMDTDVFYKKNNPVGTPIKGATFRQGGTRDRKFWFFNWEMKMKTVLRALWKCQSNREYQGFQSIGIRILNHKSLSNGNQMWFISNSQWLLWAWFE